VVYKPLVPGPGTGDDGIDLLNGLCGLVSYSRCIFKKLDMYEGRLPEGWFPIGEAGFGDLMHVNSYWKFWGCWVLGS
jgi:hypothetical protein